ncbi:Mitochondrial sorting-like protein [Aphelenchoides fujianensis]|nr:Mitochondrial sorting-like protein [Aphelenchoides fujianensis]
MSSSFRTELISICLRVSAAAAIAYFSVKYMYELRIATQLVPPDEGVEWSAIGGYDNVVNELKNRVLKPLRARADGRLPSGSSLLTPARGIPLLRTGEPSKDSFLILLLCRLQPGCGKTLMARALARSANARFIQLDLSGLTDKWYGESQKLAAAVFSLAKKLQPCIIFIDEIDSFLRVRQSTDNEATAMMKAQFMSLWDGFSSGEDEVIIAGATNRPQDVDAAILRRMPTRFFIELPDEGARASILQTILKDEYAEPSIRLRGPAPIFREICRLAALTRLNAVEEDVAWIEPSLVTIRQSDLMDAVQKYSRDQIPTFAQMILEEAD